MKSSRVILVTFFIVLSALSIFAVIAYSRNKELKDSNYWLVHTQQVLYSSENILSTLKDIETGTRGFVITGDVIFLHPYYTSKDKIDPGINHLKKITSDNPVQQVRIDSFTKLARTKLLISENIQQIRKRKDYELKNIEALVRRGNIVMDSIRANVSGFQGEEERLLLLREQTNEKNTNATETGIFILLGSTLVLLIITISVAGYYARFRDVNSSVFSQMDDDIVFFNKRLDDVLKNISDPFFALDKKFNLIYLNAAVRNFAVADAIPALGENFFKAFPRYKDNTEGEGIKEVMKTGRSKSFEVFNNFLEKWHELTVYRTSEGVSVFIKDINARKLAEKESSRIKQLLEDASMTAHIGGWEANMIDNTVSWTAVAATIFETPGDYKPNIKNLIQFYKQGEDRLTIVHLMDECIEKGKGWDVELNIITAKGNERQIRTVGKAEFHNDECIRLTGIFQDIGISSI